MATRKARRCDTSFKRLAIIAKQIATAEFDNPELCGTLRSIGEAVSAVAVTLFRTQTEGAQPLVAAGHWCGWTLSPAAANPPELPAGIVQSLHNRELRRLETLAEGAPKAELLGLPLFLNERLSGLIALRFPASRRISAGDRSFLVTVGVVMELWLLKLNSDKRFNDVIEFMPNPTIGIDTEGIATIWNPAVEKMTGIEAARMVGKGDYEYALPFWGYRRPITPNLILHPDPYYESTYPSFKREGDLIYTLMFMPALTRAGAFLTGTTRRMRDLTGRVYGALHIVRDVTRERFIESKLQSSEVMFKTITEYAGLGIALFVREKAFYYNERFETLLDISEREIRVEDLLDRVDRDSRNEIRQRVDSMLSGTEMGPLRIDLRVEADERIKYYSCYARSLDLEGKNAVCFVLDDVSEQKELAEKARLNELKMYHEGRLTSLGIMAAGIAHELNQPLNTIRVLADGILYGKDVGWKFNEAELYAKMEMVSKQVLRMSLVIQNIRNFSREEREQEFIDISVNMAVENVLSMIGRQFEAHDIAVQGDLALGLPLIKGNLNRLEQVVMNLLVNARQALDICAKSDKHIRIRTGIEEGNLFIQVVDNATGIPSEVMSKIYDPFFTTKEVGQGTGLGLTISRSIIAELGGSLEADNNEDGGATFTIKVPLQRGVR